MASCMFSCGGKSKDPTPTPPPVVPPAPKPNETTKAVLIAPAKDELCTTGVPYTSTMNKITFKWNASAFVKDYAITVKNLVTSELTTGTTTNTQIELALAKNAAFSWSVKTNSSLNSSSLESDIWRFYNAGEATSSFTPYPAELTSPLMDASVSSVSGKINLVWRGDDPDFDILSYDIYFGTTASPPLLKNDHVSALLSVSVTPATVYYWKIVTKDKLGNKSESSVFKFTVL
ncbi:hypothetical protein [Pedobacter frigiditerrae]|uniref:hypothetical protein n=1 Tax=Pedobacter frigiditerrae TaxID=2530452 RepID=UPI00293044FE|nr:hypothetical protein [Pedobacter frigiditerrae]